MRELLKNKVFRTIIIYFIICLVLFGFRSCASAKVYWNYGNNAGSNQLAYNAYTTINAGAVNFYFGTDRHYNSKTEVPMYFKLSFCVDNTVSNFRSYANSSGVKDFDNVSFYYTNTKCNYPNTGYDRGRVMYLYGSSNLNSACILDAGNQYNCYNTGKVLFNNDYQSSWVILTEEYSTTGFNIDFSGLQDDTNSTNISNNTNNIANNTNNIYTGITNSHVNGQGIHDKNDQFKNLIPTNGTITNVLLMPISLLGAYMSGISDVCHQFYLGTLFGHIIELPCIDISSFLGANLWIVIDILFSGFMIFNMGKKLVVVFNDMTSLKDTQINELYGGGK